MTVYVGSARYNENGTLEGGKFGDQTGKEVATEPWYLHSKGWYVIRAKDRSVAKLIARDMKAICDNNKIGYSYWDNCYGLYNESKKYGFDASKVTVSCDTNCAKAVLVCARYAGVNVADFNTGDEAEKFLSTGKFDLLKDDKYCTNPDNLLAGDILVTRTKGHTVVVLNDGKAMDMIKFKCSTEFCGYYNVVAKAHVRQYPSLDAPSLVVADKGVDVFCDGITAVHEDRNWFHIWHDGIEGFISGKMLEELK